MKKRLLLFLSVALTLILASCGGGSKTFNVSFNSNGGTSISTQEVSRGGKLEEFTQPTKQGYEFKGWYIDSSFNVEFDLKKEIEKDIELYAKWDIINYTITYDLDGGTNEANAPKTYDINSSFDLPTPTKLRYKFLGWYSNSGFTGNQITKINKGSEGALKLYAKWEDDNILRKTFYDMIFYIQDMGYNASQVSYFMKADHNNYLYLSTDTDPLNLNNSVLRPDYYDETMYDALEITKEIFKRLGFSQSVWNQMISTLALMGARTATENGIKATWTYHPDKGLEITYTFAD